jgi:hypothetical protein
MPDNEQRAGWALASIQGFNKAKGEVLTDADLPDEITDLIADLGHLCDRRGIDFLTHAKRAIGTWSAEKENPEPSMNHTVEIDLHGNLTGFVRMMANAVPEVGGLVNDNTGALMTPESIQRTARHVLEESEACDISEQD